MQICRGHALTIAIILAALGELRGELAVSTSFPGGSGKVERIDQNARRIVLRPTEHPGKGWACWWFVQVEGMKPGETISLEVGDAPWATPNQAAISEDGDSWRQTPIGKRVGKRIVYRLQAKANSMFVAWGPPFTSRQSAALVDRAAAQQGVEKLKLCTTRDNRPVWALHFQPTSPARFGIWIQARQHAWEAGSSWVSQGLVNWLCSDNKDSRWLREHAEIYVVPIMDVDNVAIGAGGKNQIPHDHNRDWSKQPHWRAVAAAQKKILGMNKESRFHLFIDLHNPDASSRRPYFYITPRNLLLAESQLNLDRFLAAVKRTMTGPLEFQGRTQESGASYDANWRAISKNWVARNSDPKVVAVTLETAWNTPHSNQRGYQIVGRQLAQAMAVYLRTIPEKPEPK